MVVVHPTRAGEGELIARIEGVERERIALAVADPVALEVAIDPPIRTVNGTPSERVSFEARLLDAAGNVLYGGDFLWQLAPMAEAVLPTGNTASASLVPGDPSPDVIVRATRGPLSGASTITYTPEGWVPRAP